MRVRWEQIDPHIAARVGACVTMAAETTGSETTITDASESGRRAQTVAEPRPLEMIWSVLSLSVALLVVLLYMSVCFHFGGPALTLLLTTLSLGTVGLCTFPGIHSSSSSVRRVRRPRGPLVADTQLRGAFLASATTRAERLYGELILSLAEPYTRGSMGGLPLRRELLRQCNNLLADHFRIEVQRRRVALLIDRGQVQEEAEEEIAELTARLTRSEDSVVRLALQDSLELCRDRIASVRSLETLLARLNAHDEVICQALLLARAALTRIEASPVALASPDVSGLRRTVRRVTDETRAVEEAVTELTGR